MYKQAKYKYIYIVKWFINLPLCDNYMFTLGGVYEVAMGAEWIWESLLTVLIDLHAPSTRKKVISIICIDEKHFNKVGQVFKREGQHLEMLSEAEVRS